MDGGRMAFFRIQIMHSCRFLAKALWKWKMAKSLFFDPIRFSYASLTHVKIAELEESFYSAFLATVSNQSCHCDIYGKNKSLGNENRDRTEKSRRWRKRFLWIFVFEPFFRTEKAKTKKNEEWNWETVQRHQFKERDRSQRERERDAAVAAAANCFLSKLAYCFQLQGI